MPMPRHIGNDVVDLDDRRCRGKEGDARFLARILHPAEVSWLRCSTAPERDLWILWAGKEAAFKSVSKALGQPPVFSHSAYHVEVEGGGAGAFPLRGRVRHGEHRMTLRVQLDQGALHALTWVEESPRADSSSQVVSGLGREAAPPGDWRKELRTRFTEREWECISHLPSALTRVGARDSVAKTLGVDPHRVEIACRPGRPTQRIPWVLVDGAEGSVDLSLSHHGSYQAWAFSVGAEWRLRRRSADLDSHPTPGA